MMVISADRCLHATFSWLLFFPRNKKWSIFAGNGELWQKRSPLYNMDVYSGPLLSFAILEIHGTTRVKYECSRQNKKKVILQMKTLLRIISLDSGQLACNYIFAVEVILNST
jgi:hypothetical protein